eukprot:GEMP01048861.1.p1 GENE.GEMP01048861.1~~GEMP01048861.1.p1  ORF type:complete len:457 (+),score=-9.48 GEMP01048861.1:46-1416(+)
MFRVLSNCRYFGRIRGLHFACTITSLPPKLPLPTFMPFGSMDDYKRTAQLEIDVKKARKPADRPLRMTTTRVERVNSEGNVRCSRCDIFKVPDSFYTNLRNRHGLSYYCKVCSIEQMIRYFNISLRGLMTGVLNSAKNSAKKRALMPLREKAGRFELTLDSLLNLWLSQKGRCGYSGIVMNTEPYTSWRLSLERRNNDLGYVAGNVLFVCAEFNTPDFSIRAKHCIHGTSQWSRDKVRGLPGTIAASEILSCSILRERVPRNRGISTRKIIPHRSITANGELLCSKCDQLKPIDDFYINERTQIGRSGTCKVCQITRVRDYVNSFDGFLLSRICSAKLAAKQREQKGRTEAGEFTLTFADVVSMYKEQRGLCFYSGIQMIFRPSSGWMCSIERLDNSRGYTLGNVALICVEFQTTDHSRRAKGFVQGTPQWSKEKVMMLVQWLNSSKLAFGDKCGQ